MHRLLFSLLNFPHFLSDSYILFYAPIFTLAQFIRILFITYLYLRYFYHYIYYLPPTLKHILKHINIWTITDNYV
jgi:hypothetical protein